MQKNRGQKYMRSNKGWKKKNNMEAVFDQQQARCAQPRSETACKVTNDTFSDMDNFLSYTHTFALPNQRRPFSSQSYNDTDDLECWDRPTPEYHLLFLSLPHPAQSRNSTHMILYGDHHHFPDLGIDLAKTQEIKQKHVALLDQVLR